MNNLLGTLMLATALGASSSAAMADDKINEQRPIDARVLKVRLGGLINLNLKQGALASLVLVGQKRDLARVSVTQEGDTLTIDTESGGWHFGNNERHDVRAELTLPKLSQLDSHGVGATDIKGFTADELRLSLDGAGSMTMSSNYRNIVARLGGVGNMTLNAGNTEQVDLKLRGAGRIEVNGSAKLLRAHLGGVGSLEARSLQAEAVELDMSGLGGATVFAKSSANLKLNGLGSATVYGNPGKRSSEARGLGSISWQ